MTRRIPPLLNNLILLACLASVWALFAPQQLGGQVSYVMVNGVSMLPNYRGGDLVVVRRAADYAVGDVVAYHDAIMEANVIHRIIAAGPDKFTLQGDNNSWIDAYRPTQAEMIGKEWLHLPGMANRLGVVRRPANLALLVGLLGFFLMVTILPKETNPRKRKRRPPARPAESFEIALYILLFLTVVFGGLGILAFTRPALKAGEKQAYEQRGAFSYSAAGSPGVYDTGAARSGEPVFVKLACQLEVQFDYELAAAQAQNIAGTQTFQAVILERSSGWQRTLPLEAETRFSGSQASSRTSLDLCEVEALVAAVEQETGFRSSSYLLSITPNVAVSGVMAGQAFSDTFAPSLTFQFDSLHFFLARDSSDKDPLQSAQKGEIENPVQVSNVIALPGGGQVAVAGLRMAAVIGLAVCLGGLLVLGLAFYEAASHEREMAIRLQYGALLLDVQDAHMEIPEPVVNVPTIQDLARLAERQNSMILHIKRGQVHFYYVTNEGNTYRYVRRKMHLP